jgi:hypothetical protein
MSWHLLNNRLTATVTVARSRTYSWASPAEKVRPLKKKLGRKHIQLKFFGFACHLVVAILSKQIVWPR